MSDDEERLLGACWDYAREVRDPDRALRLVHEARGNEASRASDHVDELVRAARPQALPLLVRMAVSAPDGDALAFFAAGPLEKWMERADDEALVGAAAAARREPRFFAATKLVWLSEKRRRQWEGLVESHR